MSRDPADVANGPRACVAAKRQCLPTGDFCRCWWESSSPDNFNHIYQLAACMTGTCSCPSAAECKFPRCTNCDSPMDATGKTIDLDWAEEWNRCPECGGPIHGA